MPRISYAPDYIKVRACTDDVHLLELHDVLQLGPHLARLPQQLGVQEVADGPVVPVPVRLPCYLRALTRARPLNQ